MVVVHARNVTQEIAELLKLGDDVLSIQLNFVPEDVCTIVITRALTEQELEGVKAIVEKYDVALTAKETTGEILSNEKVFHQRS